MSELFFWLVAIVIVVLVGILTVIGNRNYEQECRDKGGQPIISYRDANNCIILPATSNSNAVLIPKP